MIDFEIEQPLSLAEAAKTIPPVDGRKPSIPTLFRWCRYGLLTADEERVFLEHARIGRKMVTSREALHRFFDRLAGNADESHPNETSVADERAIAAAGI